MRRLLKLFPLVLGFPYLVAKFILWIIYQPKIYQHLILHRILVAQMMNFCYARLTQFETLAIVGIFLVVHNLLINKNK